MSLALALPGKKAAAYSKPYRKLSMMLKTSAQNH